MGGYGFVSCAKMKTIAMAALAAAVLLFGISTRAEERFLPAYETVFSKLGSRFSVNPQPQKHGWKQSPMGVFMDTDSALYAGVNTDGITAALPFQQDLPQLVDPESAVAMNSARYRARHLSGLEVGLKVTAPFYPRDVKLSIAPFFYVDMTVENKSGARKSGTAFFGKLIRRDEKVKAEKIGGLDGLTISGEYSETPMNKMQTFTNPERFKKIGAETAMVADTQVAGAEWMAVKFLSSLPGGVAEKAPSRSAGWTAPFDLEAGGKMTVRFIFAAYVPGEVLFRKDGVKYKFKYTDLFDGAGAVVSYAAGSRAEILKKSDAFEAIFAGMSLQDSYKDFLSYAFQSWMINTWWNVAPGQPEWFSETEGDCLWQSTVDVSYNTALIYYELWPELLRMQFDEWPMFKDGPVIMHDMGRLLELNGTKYSMPVEENANYILMLHHYLAVTGDEAFVKTKMPLVKEIAGYIIDADANKDGLPEKGNYNTYERHLPNPLGGEDVVYVAVKAYAAMIAAADLAEREGDPALAADAKKMAARFEAAFDKRAWTGDHYVICLQKTIPAGTIDHDWSLPRSSLPTGSQVYQDTIPKKKNSLANSVEVPLKYYDGYTILTTNGLFYLMRGGVKFGLDAKRLEEDMVNATLRTWREAGCTHTSDPDDRGMWISANVWRDMTAAYLGLDWSRNFNAYWPAARMEKGYNEGVFADSHWYDMDPQKGWDLRYYPRGSTAFGVPSALAGMQFDATAKTLKFAPVADKLHIPLLAFTDWDAGKTPWLTVTEKDGRREIEISDKELLSGWKIEQ